MTSSPFHDQDLERAMAAEAVYAYDRYLAFGVGPSDFASVALRGVVEAAQAAWEADGAVNLETVSKALQRAGKLAQFGGAEKLAEALESPAVADPERFVELRRLRTLREAALKVAAETDRGDLSAALRALGEAQTTAIDAGRVQAIDGFQLGIKLLEAIRNNARGLSTVHPGLPMLHRATGEIPLGSLTVLGGGTNTGKSQMALELLVHTAELGISCGYVSCEDPESVLSARLLNIYSGISSKQLACGRLGDDEWRTLTAAYGPLEALKERLWFAFTVGGTDVDVCAAMSRIAMRGAKTIVVDYVQAIDSSKRQQDRRNEIRWLCARLKAHAQRLNVHLVLVSQLGRPGKGDEHREPTKHDLKEAGDLENAAEYVVLIWREREDDLAELNVKLAKSKFGNIGTIWKMARNARTARLEEVDGSFQSAALRRQKGEL